MDLVTLLLPLIASLIGFGVSWLGHKYQWFGFIDNLALSALRAVEEAIPDDTTNTTEKKIDAALKVYLSMRAGTVSDAEIAKVKEILAKNSN